MNKSGYVYIMTNNNNSVLYTGVTNDILRRVYEHKFSNGSKFTKRYNCHKLVYFKSTGDIESAIFFEKKIKSGSREKKINLIQELNPEWNDLSNGWFD